MYDALFYLMDAEGGALIQFLSVNLPQKDVPGISSLSLAFGTIH